MGATCSNSFSVNPVVAGNNMISSSLHASSRREVFQSLIGGVVFAGTAFATNANALDMDAFIGAELASDKNNCDPKKDPKCIPKLTQDEALCKYGQSGDARGEACKRVKASGKQLPDVKPQGKSLGGAYAM